MSEKRQWFIEENGSEVGPITSQQLKELAASGKLRPSTRIRLGTDGQWNVAAKVKGLWNESTEPPRISVQSPAVQTAKPILANPSVPKQIPQMNVSQFPMEASPGIDARTFVNVTQPSAAANSFGISSLVIGVLGLMTSCVPLVGIGLGALGLVLGIVGIILASSRKGTGAGFAIAGSCLSIVPIGVAIVVLTMFGAAAATISEAGRQMADNLDKQVKELEAKESIDKAAKAELLSGFIVESASVRFEKDAFGVGKELVVKLKVRNNTGHAIGQVTFECVYQTPGRSIPWNKGRLSYKPSGGLEHGESATWELSPNMFSEWSSLEEKPDAVFEAKAVDFRGADGKSILPEG